MTVFFGKCQNPHPMPDPPLGLDIDKALHFALKSYYILR